MASTGKRVFFNNGAPLTLPGMTSARGHSDQSSFAMPAFYRNVRAEFVGKPSANDKLEAMRLGLCAIVLIPLASAIAQDGAVKETVQEQFAKRAARLWSLQPVSHPEVPAGLTASKNPIDAFIAAEYKSRSLAPVGKADRLTLLRRVYFDLIGIPPTIAEQEAFVADQSPDAY
jgi:hypothetical protein